MNKEHGFTIMELIIAILIVGILAGIAVPVMNNAIIKSKLVQMFTDISSLDSFFNKYELSAGTFYPPNFLGVSLHPINDDLANDLSVPIGDLPDNQIFEYLVCCQREIAAGAQIPADPALHPYVYCLHVFVRVLPGDENLELLHMDYWGGKARYWEVCQSHPWGQVLYDELVSMGEQYIEQPGRFAPWRR